MINAMVLGVLAIFFAFVVFVMLKKEVEITHQLRSDALVNLKPVAPVTQQFIDDMKMTFGTWARFGWFYANLGPNKGGLKLSQNLEESGVPSQDRNKRVLYNPASPKARPPKDWSLKLGSSSISLSHATCTVDGRVPTLMHVLGKSQEGAVFRLDVAGVEIVNLKLTKAMLDSGSDDIFVSSGEFNGRAVFGLIMYVTNKKSIDSEIDQMPMRLKAEQIEDESNSKQFNDFLDKALVDAYKAGLRSVFWVSSIVKHSSDGLTVLMIDKQNKIVFVKSEVNQVLVSAADVVLEHSIQDVGSSKPSLATLKRGELSIWSDLMPNSKILNLATSLK